MIVYYALFVGFIFSSLLSLDRNKIFGRQALFFVVLSMLLVLGLRYAVGNDYFSYKRIFIGVDDFGDLGFFIYSLSESTPVESGFAFLILTVKSFTDSYEVFVFLLAVFSIFIKYRIFNKLSPFVAISFLIYFSDEWFWKDLSGARSAVASTLILYSFYYVYWRKKIAFLVFVFFATLFHTASIVALPFYLARGFFNTRLSMVLILILATGVAALGGIGLIISEIALSLGMDDNSRLVKYTTSKYVEGISPFGGTFTLHFVLSLLMIFFYKPLSNKWAYNSILIPVYVYGTALMYVLIDYGIVSGGIREMLCVPALVVVLPSFILLFKGNQRLVPFGLVICYCILWFYMMIHDRAPYQSILSLTL